MGIHTNHTPILALVVLHLEERGVLAERTHRAVDVHARAVHDFELSGALLWVVGTVTSRVRERGQGKYSYTYGDKDRSVIGMV